METGVEHPAGKGLFAEDFAPSWPSDAAASGNPCVDLPYGDAAPELRMLRPRDTPAPGSIAGERPPFAEALAFTSAVSVVLDLTFGWALPTWRSYAFALGIALPAGAAAGYAASFVSRNLLTLRPRLRSAVWSLLGATAGAGIAVQLGAASKLHGPHALVAAATLVLVPGAAAVVGWLTAIVLLEQTVSAEIARKHAVFLIAVAALSAVAQQLLGDVPNCSGLILGLAWATNWLAALAIVRVGRSKRLDPVLPFFLATCAFAGLIASVSLRPSRRADLVVLSNAPASRAMLAAMRFLTDVDGDGVSHLFGENDCAPWNPAIHPGAREIPGNGVDDNCLFGDAAPHRLQHPTTVPMPAGAPPRSVIIITIDTLRPDHMSLYGYQRETTPNLARHMASGWVFTNAFTSGGHTMLAVPSMMRGMYPRRLVWTCPQGGALPPDDPRPSDCGLDRTVSTYSTLAQSLHGRGLTTIAATTRFGYRHIQTEIGREAGFDLTVGTDASSRPSNMTDNVAVDAAITALRQLPPERRFFLWIHLYGPHLGTSTVPRMFASRDSMIDDYDQAITEADFQAGRLLDYLSSRPDAAELLTIVSADHGEHLSNGGRSHGTSLVAGAIRIPLLVRGAETTAATVTTPASLVDVAPTVFRAEGMVIPGWMDGTPLQEVRSGAVDDRIVFTDTWPIAARLEPDQMLSAATGATHTQACDGLAGSMHLWRTNDRDEVPRDWVGHESDGRLEQALLHYLDETDGTFWRE